MDPFTTFDFTMKVLNVLLVLSLTGLTSPQLVRVSDSAEDTLNGRLELAKMIFMSSAGTYNGIPCMKVKEKELDLGQFDFTKPWLFYKLNDLYGTFLSPFFNPYPDSNCIKVWLSQYSGKIKMEFGCGNRRDFMFLFNNHGEIEYPNPYGCHQNRQITSARIVETDYKNFIILFGCYEVLYGTHLHVAGVLVLVAQSKNISQSTEEVELQRFLDKYSEDHFAVSVNTVLNLSAIKDEPCACSDVKNACSKTQLRAMELYLDEIRKDFVNSLKTPVEEPKQLGYQRLEPESRPHEIACLLIMFIGNAVALYWTHFII